LSEKDNLPGPGYYKLEQGISYVKSSIPAVDFTLKSSRNQL